MLAWVSNDYNKVSCPIYYYLIKATAYAIIIYFFIPALLFIIFLLLEVPNHPNRRPSDHHKLLKNVFKILQKLYIWTYNEEFISNPTNQQLSSLYG